MKLIRKDNANALFGRIPPFRKLAIPVVIAGAATLFFLFKPSCEGPMKHGAERNGQAVHMQNDYVRQSALNAFRGVFEAKGKVEAQKAIAECHDAKKMLQNTGKLGKEQQALVVGKIVNGSIVEKQVLTSQRPDCGESAVSDDGRFSISRASKENDPGGVYSELFVRKKGEEGECWAVLAAKVFASSRSLGKRHYLVCPFSGSLYSGKLADEAMGYLSAVDSVSRAAIRKFSGRKDVLRLLDRVPKNANTLIAIVEAMDPAHLGNEKAMEKALSHYLFNVAIHRNQAKFLTISSAHATGPYQIVPKTEGNLLRIYGGEPLLVFSSWAEESGYPPYKWLNRANDLGDLMYSSILAYYHHFDILANLEARIRAHGLPDAIYRNELQTMCAIASGYNGGAPNAWEKITSQLADAVKVMAPRTISKPLLDKRGRQKIDRKGRPRFHDVKVQVEETRLIVQWEKLSEQRKSLVCSWHEYEYSRGLDCLGMIKNRLAENLGYVVKTNVFWNPVGDSGGNGSGHVLTIDPSSRENARVEAERKKHHHQKKAARHSKAGSRKGRHG